MKNKYVTPELLLTEAEIKDIISVSGMSCVEGNADFQDNRTQKYIVSNDFWS